MQALDQKLMDQQGALWRANVPGFHVTNDPKEIQTQMHLLGLIQRLGDKYGKAGGGDTGY